MGEEKLDNAVYLIRGLYDLADMAKAKKTAPRDNWADDLANKLRASFDDTWWNDESSQYADSLNNRPTRRSSRSTGSASRRWRPS